MESKSVLAEFAKRYVVHDFRERFIHEATKRPDKLHARICHNIGDVLPDSFAGGRSNFAAEEICLVLDGEMGFHTKTWGALQAKVGLGEGLLAVCCNGSQFYAETEAAKGVPSVVYGSSS